LILEFGWALESDEGDQGWSPGGGRGRRERSGQVAVSVVEIAVLRHQLAVVRPQVARPRYTPADRILRAALAMLLPRAPDRPNWMINVY
jgi:hypothetical protein